MTWHKHGKRYNVDKMVHPSDGDAWTHFDGIHHGKAEEARNVRVVLAIDATPMDCWWSRTLVGPCS